MTGQKIVITPKEIRKLKRMVEAYEMFHKDGQDMKLMRFGDFCIVWNHLERGLIELRLGEIPDEAA